MSVWLNIGFIGLGFMGQVYVDVYCCVVMFYFDLFKCLYFYVLVDQDQVMVECYVVKLGVEKVYGDWCELVNDLQVDVVDIILLNYLYYIMVMVVIVVGKYVYCEKLLVVNEQQVQEMVQVVWCVGVKIMVVFNNIKMLVVLLVKQIIVWGDIGELVCFCGIFDQGFYNDLNLFWFWCCLKIFGGSGVFGDFGVYILFVVQFLLGGICEVIVSV